MSEKRYFERKWEGEYYIFDSYTISEKEFDEKVEYEDYQAFKDSMTGEEVTDRLNKYNKEYLDCHNDVLRLEKENEKLKNKLKFFNELNKPYGDIIKENEQLQKQLSDVRKENYGNLDGINYYQEQNASLSERISDLKCENEQLRNRINDWHQRTFKAHEYFNILEKVIDEVCNDEISNQIWKEYEKREKLIE